MLQVCDSGRCVIAPPVGGPVKFNTMQKLLACGAFLAAGLCAGRLNAQHLTLEGQTGGFLTPTAYVVYTGKDKVFSHPAIGYHFINTSAVIGNIQTFSFLEGVRNRAEVGYTRSVHTDGNSALFSNLWNYNGMNIFNGKVVAIKDGQFGALMPGFAAGFVVRTGDHFVTGALDGKTYTNGDLYVAATKTWLHPPLPLLLNLGWKATNASIFGIGGQSTRFGGRVFGGLGIPLPGPFKTVLVPSAGFTQEPATSKNLGAILVGGTAHLPTTLDYAVRVTQKEHPHFSFDIGIGQVAGMIGTTEVNVAPVGIPPVYVGVPVNLEARHVLGIGLSVRP